MRFLAISLILLSIFLVSSKYLLVTPKLEIRIYNFSTDKKIYHPKENIKVNLEVYSSLPSNATLKIYGIKNRWNSYRINEVRNVTLSKGLNLLNFNYVTPSCYGCAGVSPGEHKLNVEILFSYEKINSSLSIEIRP